MTEPAKPRPRPCASCPYRRDVPSGIWSAEEYGKLPAYDGEIIEQALAGGDRPFFCHAADGHLCSGWLGHRDPADLLAVRVGVATGRLDASAAQYSTSVPLFASGAEAAEHGKAEMESPPAKARELAAKIARGRETAGGR